MVVVEARHHCVAETKDKIHSVADAKDKNCDVAETKDKIIMQLKLKIMV